MKGCRTLCVSIIELQINYKISFKEVLNSQKSKKKKKCKKNLWQKERDLFFKFVEVKSARNIPIPKTPSTTICKIIQNFVIILPSFFVDVINE